MPAKSDRKQKSVTLPETHIDRLAVESEKRVMGESALVQKGLDLLFAKFDGEEA